jgi:hypothetical protein
MADPVIDAYTCAEVDKKLEDLKDEMLENISKQVKMSSDSPKGGVDVSTLFLQIDSTK